MVQPTPARRWVIDRRARLMAALAGSLTLLFLLLAFVLQRAAGTATDLAITDRVQSVDNAALMQLMVAISVPGYWPWSWFIVGLAVIWFWLLGLRREVLFLLLTPGAGLLSGLAKTLVERPRPTGDGIRIMSQLLDYSYPSGHVVGYVSFYGLLFFFVYVLFKRSPWRTGALFALGSLVGLIGLSRIYVGHHWVSDAIGGYALGAAYLLILIEIYRLTTVKPRRDHQPGVETSWTASSRSARSAR
jgi:undecaprenyl-diphosphatase